MFSPNHFIWIAICIVFIGVLLFVSLKWKLPFKVCSYIMLGICLASELSKIFTHIETTSDGGGVLGAPYLPLHLCSILIFVVIYFAFSKNEKMLEKLKTFFVPIAIIGGLLAILMATSGVDFAKPFAYQCFIYHAGLMWFAIYLMATKQVKMGLKEWGCNLLILISLVFIMLWVNSALQVYDVNFFYLVKPPVKGLPLLNLNHGWYAYFAVIICSGFVLVSLVHLPYIIIETIKKKKVVQDKEIK